MRKTDDSNSMAVKIAGNNLEPYKGLKWMTEEELFNSLGLQAVAVEVGGLNTRRFKICGTKGTFSSSH